MRMHLAACVLTVAAYVSCAFGGSSTGRQKIIVALGDSTTAGTPFFLSPRERPPRGIGDETASYPYWLARKLSGWKVYNQGVNGQRSDQVKGRFERDVVALEPRYVIILAGVNDIYQGVPTAKTEDNLLWMYRRAIQTGIVPIAATVLPFDLATESQNQRIKEINHWIADTAEKMRIPVCNFNQAARDPRNPLRLRGSAEGLHPDAATYRLMGEAAAKLVAGQERAGAR